MKKLFDMNNKYVGWGITAFVVVACAIVFYMLLHYVGSVIRAIEYIIKVLGPFIWGVIIAYILSPATDFNENKIFIPLLGKIDGKKHPRLIRVFRSRWMSIALAEIIMIAIVVTLIALVLPQVYNSIELIIFNSPTYLNKILSWVENMLKNWPAAEAFVTDTMGNIGDAFTSWISDQVLPRINYIISNVTNSVIYILKGLYNIIIGIIVSVYLLNKKEAVIASLKKIIYSVFPLKIAQKIKVGCSFTDQVFRGFISGKMLDSAIIGVLCYIFCVIARMPYALLISIIVGLTNIIPFFGPFIGAIPSILLILMVSPSKALIFGIAIIVLQQFDGNILGPRILGDTTGVGGFWVLFSIVLGAGLFGFWGMLLGVPVWVIIYTVMKKGIDKNLKKKGLPVELDNYVDLDYIDIKSGECVKYSEEVENVSEYQTNSDESSSSG